MQGVGRPSAAGPAPGRAAAGEGPFRGGGASVDGAPDRGTGLADRGRDRADRARPGPGLTPQTRPRNLGRWRVYVPAVH
ncbi:hypothetical protein GCM10010371_38240 [Streptomyces subrutilus]|uniref:Uncharacterized protein n=1 Tax=Streptomyces subrutilus TaxID=36818 RepID=A0A918QXT6_9ACTN|nr:hypothetical protein GCM10010371_38240 [Streptomyces subrutilus]